MKIGLVSDTHMPSRAKALPAELMAALAGVELILHAGDLNTLAVLRELGELADVEAVAGNTDPWEVANLLGDRYQVELEGVSIGLTHGHLGRGTTTPDRAVSRFTGARVVVFGHSHRPRIEARGGVLLVNPGSPTDPRGAPQRTCAILTVECGQARAELVGW